MKLFSLLLAAGALVFASAAHADGTSTTPLAEGFDDISNMPGWVTVNQSAPPGAGWFQGNSGVFGAHSGAVNSYIGANYLATSHGGGTVDLWLISPVLSIGDNAQLNFWMRTAGGGYSDHIDVWFGAGAGTDPTHFSLVATPNMLSNDVWNHVAYTLPGLGEGRLAFRYSGPAAQLNYVGIDSLSLAPVPEPATYVMFCIGLAALLGMRHSRAMVACGTIAISSAAFAAAPPQQSGMVVVRDPQTGQLRAPTASEFRALHALSSALQAGQPAPKTLVRPDGTVQRSVGAEGMSYTVVSRGKDGKLSIECVSGEPDAHKAHKPRESGHEAE